MVQAAINGLGRIGRTALRVFLERSDLHNQLDFKVINTSGSMEIEGWANALKYDTAYRKLPQELSVEKVKEVKAVTEADPLIGYFHLAGRKIAVLAQRDPEKIPWSQYGVEVVIEATGVFRDEKGAGKHIKAGAKKVLVSAPSKGGQIGTYVLGVNAYDGKFPIADNASCTTNCIAPIAAVIHEKLGIKKAALTTVHAYTDDQNLQDGSHPEDLRRARAAAMNLVPTSTGAAKAVTQTMPELKGLFDGIAIRAPVVTGSISDLTFVVKKPTTVAAVKQIIKEAAESERWRGLIAWTEEPLVSSDIIGRKESAIVDLEFTQVIDGDLVKILAWYDNEWGYCNRLIEQAIYVGTH
ncbi:type I glyceraldehyde-3-phosphate dehydrogenase [Microgenomates group bacterium RBG_16_45_19]|nr:MAG: type I glyceraldehyde-3-phosphate dehydrogenase [Microgenomates group bacterium RBG_16_45_19]